MKSILLLFIAFIVCSCKSVEQAKEETVYMFSYFTDNGEDGLHLAYSFDGLKWEALNQGKSFLMPQVGKDKLMRDPSIVQDIEGTFHMVWTSGWWDQGIGYASSKDLKNWTEQRQVPVMDKFEGTRNSWAPELFYDKEAKAFYIIWSSTIPGAFPETENPEIEKGLNHRLYYATTKDFKTFSDTKLYFDPGFNVIDGAILHDNDTFYLFVKNETLKPEEKNIRVTSGKIPYDFPATVSPPITGNYWAEGPSPLRVGEYVYVYFDKYVDKKYGAVRSKDMQKWEYVSDTVVFPPKAKHGTAFVVSKKFFNSLNP